MCFSEILVSIFFTLSKFFVPLSKDTLSALKYISEDHSVLRYGFLIDKFASKISDASFSTLCRAFGCDAIYGSPFR